MMKFSVITNALEVVRSLLGYKSDVDSGMTQVLLRDVQRANNIAVDLLSGHSGNTGGYPVPVKTGYLRRMQTFIGPGEAKNIPNIGTIRTDKGEIALGNGAVYALMIHDGKGTSSAYGARPFMQDAMDQIQPEVERDIKDLFDNKAAVWGF